MIVINYYLARSVTIQNFKNDVVIVGLRINSIRIPLIKYIVSRQI